MATTNNAVTVTAGLICSALDSPPIGSSAVSASIGFESGDNAADTYATAAYSSPTTLFTGNADGFVFIYNPSSNGDAVNVILGSQAMGPLPVGFACVFPYANTVAVKVQSAGTADQPVGYTRLDTHANT